MSDDRVESHVEIQKFASNADKSNMESVADVFADEIETDFFATSNIQSQLDEVVHLCQLAVMSLACWVIRVLVKVLFWLRFGRDSLKLLIVA